MKGLVAVNTTNQTDPRGAFITCPSALGKLCFPKDCKFSVLEKLLKDKRASAEQESSTERDSSCIRNFLVPPPFLSSAYLIHLK